MTNTPNPPSGEPSKNQPSNPFSARQAVSTSEPASPAIPGTWNGAPKHALRFIFITLVFDVLGFGLLIPVAPKLVEKLLNNGTGGTEAQAAPIVGMLMSTFYFFSFLFAPLLGVLSDRFGRRPIILIALLGSGIDFFAQALAPSLTWLFITRAINGISGASFTVASAYIADVTPPEKRAAGFGMIGAAFGLGFVIGPVLGGWLGQIDIRLPFFVAGGLTVLNWLYGCFVLPESLPKDRRGKIDFSRTNPVGAFVSLTRYPMVLGLAASLFLLNIAQFILHSTWALYTSHRYHWEPFQVGTSLFTVGVTAAIVQGGLTRRVIPVLGERRSLLFGILIGAFAYLGYGAAPQGWMIYVVIVLGSIAGIGQPACQAIITKHVGADEQGAVQGALTSLQSVAGIFGPLIGGNILAYFISDTASIYLPGASFFVSALLSLAGLAVAAWAIGRAPRP